MREDLINDAGLFDGGDDSDGAAAVRAGFDVDFEYAPEPLRPCHRRPALGGRLGLLGVAGLTAGRFGSARGELVAMAAVGREDSMESGQVDAGLGHQGRQTGDDKSLRRYNDR